MKRILLTVLYCSFVWVAKAQSSDKNSARPREIVLLAGLVQPLVLQGGNVEIEYYTPRLVFAYSHGFSLDLDRAHGTVVGEARAQSLALHLPYSTGLSIGYRLSHHVDVRLESKLHRFDVYYDGTDRRMTINQIGSYNTATLGVGAYFRWKPFERQSNALRGITTSTSIRYWPTIWSSLDANQLTYQNRITNERDIHQAANIGFANTPFIFNIAIGYTIPLR